MHSAREGRSGLSFPSLRATMPISTLTESHLVVVIGGDEGRKQLDPAKPHEMWLWGPASDRQTLMALPMSSSACSSASSTTSSKP